MAIFSKKKDFDAIIEEAVTLRKELNKLSGPAKLSREAFFKKSLEYAGITEDRLIEIEKVIEAGPQFETTRRFIEKATTYVKSKDCSAPSPKLNRLSFLVSPDEFTTICAELAAISCNPFTAFAVATRQAIRKHPEAFGDIEDMSAYQKKLQELETTLQSLYKHLSTEWTADDIDIVPAGNDLFRVTYKVSKGAVSVGCRNAGQALIDHLIMNTG